MCDPLKLVEEEVEEERLPMKPSIIQSRHEEGLNIGPTNGVGYEEER